MAQSPIDHREPSPDKYTNAWYAQQYHTLMHHWQRSMEEEAQLTHQVRMMRKEVNELAKQRQSDMAKIGEMSVQIEELTKRLDEAAKVVLELKKKAKP